MNSVTHEFDAVVGAVRTSTKDNQDFLQGEVLAARIIDHAGVEAPTSLVEVLPVLATVAEAEGIHLNDMTVMGTMAAYFKHIRTEELEGRMQR